MKTEAPLDRRRFLMLIGKTSIASSAAAGYGCGAAKSPVATIEAVQSPRPAGRIVSFTTLESIDATEHFGYATRFVNEPDCKTLNRENPPVNGVQILSHIDFGPREIDKNSPNIAWFAKLKMLNEWAERRSDSFVISHERVGWVDERGYVEPTKQDTLDTTEKRDSQKNPSAQKIKTKEKGPAPDLSCISHEKWYSTFQTAKILVLTPKHVRDILIMEGKLKAEKRPNHWMVQGQTIIDYINRN